MLASKWVIGALAFAVPALAGASTLKTLYSITGSPDGTGPTTALTAMNGLLYGTTATGGVTGHGTVFRLDSTTGKEKVIYTFSGGSDGDAPNGPLIAVHGHLYGVTSRGGASRFGTVFSIDPRSGAETVLHSFAGGSDGIAPVAIVDADGLLYGVTSEGGALDFGTLFSVDTTTGTESILFAFQGGSDAAYPSALIRKGDVLYGTTGGGGTSGFGTIFKFDRVAGTESVVYSINMSTDGYDPVGLTDVANQLYVAVSYGGPTGWGTVIKVDPANGAESVVYTFAGGTDGGQPFAAMTQGGTALYGTTFQGGTSGQGTVFRLDPKSGQESVLYSFTSGADGGMPTAALISDNGTLYGTTSYGGLHSGGTAFEIDPDNGTETALHAFAHSPYQTNADGLLAAKGKLLVTTAQGGPFNLGAVVSIDPANGAAKTVDGFADPTYGTTPEAALIKAAGALYGTTIYGGGAGHHGTVFKFDPRTGAASVVYAFTDGVDGGYPTAPLLLFRGKFYGTTAGGGAQDSGTIFKVDPASGAETSLYSFGNGNDGDSPYAGLINVNGVLYGTTMGTIFAFDPASGTTTTVYSFSGNDGMSALGGLLELRGLLYGTTYYGGVSGGGTLFSFNPANSAFTVLHAFTGGADGAYPANTLTAINGLVYGVTAGGGPSYAGTIFELNPATAAYTVLYTFTDGSDGGAPCAPLIAVASTLYGGTCEGGAANLGTLFSFTP
jgi:uncharacterized repeat protein (TIGR03803 family)